MKLELDEKTAILKNKLEKKFEKEKTRKKETQY